MARKKAVFFPAIIGNIAAYLQNIFDKMKPPPGGDLAAKYSTAAAFMALLTGWLTSLPGAIQKAFADSQTAQQSTNAQNQLIGSIQAEVLKELTAH